MVALAWFLISASLLVVSGAAKLVDPAPTVGALEAARLPHRRWHALALGLVEVIVAATAIVFGGIATIAVALLYAAFAVFVVVALRGDLPLASCGCFGKADTPPTWLHVGYNATSALAAGFVAARGLGGLDAVAGLSWFAGAAYLGFVGLGVWVSYLVLSELPRLRAEARPS